MSIKENIIFFLNISFLKVNIANKRNFNGLFIVINNVIPNF